MPLNLIDAFSTQSFTKPPPRFTEASLVKELERLGIGRPSTYAAIMNKIQSRDYTVKEAQALKPTELGKVICQMLEDNFAPIMDVTFTAQMEDQLEQVAEHNKDWKEIIRTFWKDFIPLVEKAEKEAIVPKVLTDLDCPKCGSKLQKIWSRSKYFYGCSHYPDCDFTSPIEAITFNKEDYAADFDWEQKCSHCGSPMTLRFGRFGAFLGCSKYPDCKGIVNIPKAGEIVYQQEDMPACPAVGCNGHLSARKSRFGKTFFSCTNYPDCDVIVNNLEDAAAKYIDHPKTAYVKKRKGKWGKGKDEKGKDETAKSTKGKKASKTASKGKGSKTTAKKSAKPAKSNQPAYKLSKELADIVGAPEMARMEVTKKLWDYIKSHDLQDPKNKRTIVPDEKLAKVIGKKPVDMMKLAGLLSEHFQK